MRKDKDHPAKNERKEHTPHTHTHTHTHTQRWKSVSRETYKKVIYGQIPHSPPHDLAMGTVHMQIPHSPPHDLAMGTVHMQIPHSPAHDLAMGTVHIDLHTLKSQYFKYQVNSKHFDHAL